MSLLKELNQIIRSRSYKHLAPNGALSPGRQNSHLNSNDFTKSVNDCSTLALIVVNFMATLYETQSMVIIRHREQPWRAFPSLPSTHLLCESKYARRVRRDPSPCPRDRRRTCPTRLP